MGVDVENKVRRITINLPGDIYERLRYKSYSEGYSMQEALRLLIDFYLQDEQ